MRLTVAKKIHYDAGPNLTPLADVAMVILIFLMLVGSFGTEHYLANKVPLQQIQNVEPSGQWLPDEPLRIDVQSVGNGFEAVAGKVHTSNIDALTQQLARMRQQLAQAGTAPEQVRVVIAPQKSTRYNDLIRVYESALNAGFTRVAFAAATD
ncbi:MAG TPA: biopolymer transporter ExbD [Tepidisphaeraceae bacterium]|jgi:biopolymer transport protein ExbD